MRHREAHLRPTFIVAASILGTLLTTNAARAEMRLLVLGYTSSQLATFDLSTGAPLGNIVEPVAGGLSLPFAALFLGERLYIADWGNSAVLQFNASTGLFEQVLIAVGVGGLILPSGLAIGPDGFLYVSSFNSNSILRFHALSGAPLGVFADAEDGLDGPMDLHWRPDSTLVVLCRGNRRVLHFSADGTALSPLIYDDPKTPVDETGGMGLPGGMVDGGDGQLHLSSNDGAVRTFDRATGAYLGMRVAPGAGGLADARGMVLGEGGTLYVAAFDAHSIKRYAASGAYLGDLVSPFGGGIANPVWLDIRCIRSAEVVAGDLNCDGVVSVGDIGPFVLALTDPAGYVAAFPECDLLRADLNCDGQVTVSDIGPFVQRLSGRGALS